MIVKTNKEIKEGYLKNNLKAKNLIAYLLKNGFTSTKEVFYSALNDLDYQGQKIKQLSLNSDKIEIIFKK